MQALLIAMIGLGMAVPGMAIAAVCGNPPYEWHCVINNGLAPPSPENVIDDGTHSGDWIFVRNVGCPPDWPDGVYAFDECPSPGAATVVSLTAGGAVQYLDVWDSSSVTMNEGQVGDVNTWNFSTLAISAGTVNGNLYADDSSTVTVLGGAVNGDLYAYASSAATLSGGAVAEYLLAYDDSTIAIVGEGFEVDGVPVPYGDLTAQTGTLTGTLAAGDTIDNIFCQGGYMDVCTGTITLVESPVETCGDGTITGAEECDDGNDDPGDGCDASCQIEPGWTCAGEPSVCDTCGDGTIVGTEECDDGGTDPGDGCDASCQIESGWICLGEPSICSICGDGTISGLEECDDGNTTPRDGCNASCQIEPACSCVGEPSVCTASVPALSLWSQLVLALSLIGFGAAAWRRRE